jgi:thymidylate synthase
VTALMQHHPDSFEHLLWMVRHLGEERTDRTGTGTLSLFAPMPLKFSLEDMAVPLVESKQVAWKMALHEFLWMLSGSTDVNRLRITSPRMAAIWDNWADKGGDIGPTYGAQYRDAGGTLVRDNGHSLSAGVDQLARVVKLLAEQPDTRRAVISLWSAPELDLMRLEPCMVLFQFSLRGPELDDLELAVYQRSADMMLGVPFDLFQAGFLAHAVARELTFITGRDIRARGLTWTAGDAHVYLNQVDAVDRQLEQDLDVDHSKPVTLAIDPHPGLRLLSNTLEAGHVKALDYEPQPAISAPIAV